MLTAAVGAYFTAWLSKPSQPEAANIAVLMTKRDLPEKACEALQTRETLIPTCSITAITLDNPSFEAVRNAHIKIDFKRALTKEEKAEYLSLQTYGDFLSGDVKQIEATPNQTDYIFENFPKNGRVDITLISTGMSFETPKIAAGKNTVILEPHTNDQSNSVETLFLAGLVGFLILPAIALVIGFFQWLAKETSPAEVVAPATDQRKTTPRMRKLNE